MQQQKFFINYHKSTYEAYLINNSSKHNVQLCTSIYYSPAAIMLFFDKFRQVQLEVAEAVVKTEAGRSSMQSFKELWLVKSTF